MSLFNDFPRGVPGVNPLALIDADDDDAIDLTAAIGDALILDEFAALGRMEAIEKAAGLMAGFGVKLWPFLQDLGQLKRHYKESWETFMGNAGMLQFFANADMTTLEWLSKRMGQVELIRETSGSSTSTTASLSRSQGRTETAGWSRSTGSTAGTTARTMMRINCSHRSGGQHSSGQQMQPCPAHIMMAAGRGASGQHQERWTGRRYEQPTSLFGLTTVKTPEWAARHIPDVAMEIVNRDMKAKQEVRPIDEAQQPPA